MRSGKEHSLCLAVKHCTPNAGNRLSCLPQSSSVKHFAGSIIFKTCPSFSARLRLRRLKKPEKLSIILSFFNFLNNCGRGGRLTTYIDQEVTDSDPAQYAPTTIEFRQ